LPAKSITVISASGYISDEELTLFRELLDHVGRMLTRLLKQLEA